MKKVVIFGTRDLAQLADFYLETDSPYIPIAFTVNQEFLEHETAFDKPVVPFEELEQHYPPDEYAFFAPMTGAGMNTKREKVYLDAKKRGYECISYISSRATVLTEDIGDNCFILEDNTIQPFVKIGNNVVLWSGNHIGHHSTIEDHVFFTSHVVLSGHCQVKSYSWLGVNATVRDSLILEEGTLVAMSASVTKNTKAWSTYLGVPAKNISKDSREANP